MEKMLKENIIFTLEELNIKLAQTFNKKIAIKSNELDNVGRSFNCKFERMGSKVLFICFKNNASIITYE